MVAGQITEMLVQLGQPAALARFLEDGAGSEQEAQGGVFVLGAGWFFFHSS